MKTKKTILSIVFASITIFVNAQIKVISGGNVGINNTSPGSKLVVKGSGSSSSTSAFNVTNSGGTSTFYVRDDGNVGIGTTSPNAKLHVKGFIYAEPTSIDSGAYTNFVSGIENQNYSSYSDRELRIQDVTNSGSYYQYLIYNGRISGTLTNPVYTQGKWGRFSGIEFQQTRTNFLVNTGTAGTGTSFTITPTKALTIGYNGTIGICSEYTGGFQLYVNGSAWCTGSWQSSDERFKKNIIPIDSALSKILKLNGKIYEFNKDDFKQFNFPDGKNLGFIAQEVKEVIPEAVRQDSIYYSINYDEIIPVIVEAMKQQQTQIENMQKTISELQQQLNICCITGKTNPLDRNIDIDNPSSAANVQNNTETSKSALLYQNNPNPFSQITNIKCYVPKEAVNATIYIYDMQGTQIKKIQINEREEANIIIRGFELKAGMYMYTLIIDGKEIGTKKMILTD